MNKLKWSNWDLFYYMREMTEKEPVFGAITTHGKTEKPSFDMHYCLELGYLISGRGKRLYENWEMELSPGQVWLCGMWEPHGYQYLDASNKSIVLSISPDFLMALGSTETRQFNWLAPFNALPGERPQVLPGTARQMKELVSRMSLVIASSHEHRPLWLKVLTMELILLLCKEWKWSAEKEKLSHGSYSQIAKAIELVFRSHQFISEDEAAKACGICRKKFCTVFEQLMGISFPRFSARFRISGAARQLLRTQDSVKKIASEWGFTDVSHMYRSFEEHLGCTPIEYRKKAIMS